MCLRVWASSQVREHENQDNETMGTQGHQENHQRSGPKTYRSKAHPRYSFVSQNMRAQGAMETHLSQEEETELSMGLHPCHLARIHVCKYSCV